MVAGSSPAERVANECAQQGVPLKVTDPVRLRRLAILFQRPLTRRTDEAP